MSKEKADIAWFLYDLVYEQNTKQFVLTLVETVYTEFESALQKVTTPDPGNMNDFINILQDRLDERLDGNAPEAPSLTDIIIT